MPSIIVTDIKWDTAGEDTHDIADVALPSEIQLTLPADLIDPEDIEAFISDHITDQTGFCHGGFRYDEAPAPESPSM